MAVAEKNSSFFVNWKIFEGGGYTPAAKFGRRKIQPFPPLPVATSHFVKIFSAGSNLNFVWVECENLNFVWVKCENLNFVWVTFQADPNPF